ncbi:hypothetical protein HY29_01035 [Hyphomonas beringensis]|uniref:Amidohydrolase-related domain-containing protein n=1 Tax=Hyphomonas beringensis TaxID=1280946 RepID=A0A062UMK1_9PROT|nr:amidohydrolase [Hyphomonas beringensis]KCZ57340.1 hypothetical protein HY29_01035 [Hyphomonas beringensis]
MKKLLVTTLLSAVALLPSCASAKEVRQEQTAVAGEQARPIAITHANILTASSPLIEDGTVVFANGRIVSVGKTVKVPGNAEIIDAEGRWVTPGLIDPHSHLGVYPTPLLPSNMDLNEKTGNNTAGISAEDAVWPQDPGFEKARRGGVTTLTILPGSTNLIAGKGVTLKNVEAATVKEMKFPNAPYFLKMACGENPIKIYGGAGKKPFTRMGVMSEFRKAWAKAREYKEKHEADPSAPVDLQLETMAKVLDGEIIPVVHCYRADEMAHLIDISHEYGFKIGAFHHATEAYKIAPLLKAEDIGVATWARRWGFKMEAYDASDATPGFLEDAGVKMALHSDNSILIQHMNTEAALALASARRAGYDFGYETAIKWITADPAELMGIADQTGTLEPGKMADIVLWSGDPFDVYSVADKVFIDGVSVVDDAETDEESSDFLAGQYGEEVQ